MVGNVQVVIHGLGDADDLHVQPLGLGKLTDLVAGVHGVIAAVIEEAADMEPFQSFNDGGVVRVRQLPAAGADGGSGGVSELGDGGSGNVGQIDKIALEDALRAEPGGVDLIHLAAFPGGFHNALKAGIDDSSGAAAVGDQNVDSHTHSP